MSTARVPGGRLEVLAVLAAIALLGLLTAPLPFTGDQALFAAGARQLAHGDVLYRDFWDVKQPGIYLFYLGGGSVLGYSEVALHLFELAYQLAFAVVLIVTLRGRFTRAWIGPLVPLLIFAAYYATVEPVQLGQVESLAGFPLYLTLLFAVRGAESSTARGRWLFASGLVGGLVLVLKLVLLPVVGGFWLLAAWQIARAVPTGRARAVARGLGAIAAGMLVPIGIAIAYFAAHGQLETVRWTYFTVSAQATGIAGRPLSRLTEGGFKTGARWAIPLALALVGLAGVARRGWDRLEVGLLVWLGLGVPVFLIQHWWIYNYAMFLVPVGIFAGHGLETIVDAWPGWRTGARVALVAGALVLLLPATARIARNGSDVATHNFALTTEDRTELREDLEPDYKPAAAWRDQLDEQGPSPNGVYVLGNPLNLYLADRPQTVSINGWSPEQYPEAVWQRVRQELRQAHPAELVIDTFTLKILQANSPKTLRTINESYKPYGGSGPDTWYHPRPTP
jgi:hypothetical protein